MLLIAYIVVGAALALLSGRYLNLARRRRLMSTWVRWTVALAGALAGGILGQIIAYSGGLDEQASGIIASIIGASALMAFALLWQSRRRRVLY